MCILNCWSFSDNSQNMQILRRLSAKFTLLFCFPASVPPTAATFPENQTVFEGDSMMIQCLTNGTEHFRKTWFHNGEDLLLEFNETLHYHFVNISHAGIYQCFVENEAGIGMAAAYVQVMCKYSFSHSLSLSFFLFFFFFFLSLSHTLSWFILPLKPTSCWITSTLSLSFTLPPPPSPSLSHIEVISLHDICSLNPLHARERPRFPWILNLIFVVTESFPSVFEHTRTRLQNR